LCPFPLQFSATQCDYCLVLNHIEFRGGSMSIQAVQNIIKVRPGTPGHLIAGDAHIMAVKVCWLRNGLQNSLDNRFSAVVGFFGSLVISRNNKV